MWHSVTSLSRGRSVLPLCDTNTAQHLGRVGTELHKHLGRRHVGPQHQPLPLLCIAPVCICRCPQGVRLPSEKNPSLAYFGDFIVLTYIQPGSRVRAGAHVAKLNKSSVLIG